MTRRNAVHLRRELLSAKQDAEAARRARHAQKTQVIQAGLPPSKNYRLGPEPSRSGLRSQTAPVSPSKQPTPAPLQKRTSMLSPLPNDPSNVPHARPIEARTLKRQQPRAEGAFLGKLTNYGCAAQCMPYASDFGTPGDAVRHLWYVRGYQVPLGRQKLLRRPLSNWKPTNFTVQVRI